MAYAIENYSIENAYTVKNEFNHVISEYSKNSDRNLQQRNSDRNLQQRNSDMNLQQRNSDMNLQQRNLDINSQILKDKINQVERKTSKKMRKYVNKSDLIFNQSIIKRTKKIKNKKYIKIDKQNMNPQLIDLSISYENESIIYDEISES